MEKLTEKLPWDYKKRLLEFVKDNTKLLIMGIEDENFTLSLDHNFSLTSVTAEKTQNMQNFSKDTAFA